MAELGFLDVLNPNDRLFPTAPQHEAQRHPLHNLRRQDNMTIDRNT